MVHALRGHGAAPRVDLGHLPLPAWHTRPPKPHEGSSGTSRGSPGAAAASPGAWPLGGPMAHDGRSVLDSCVCLLLVFPAAVLHELTVEVVGILDLWPRA
eukprot:699244-Pyramimonas_sp.AAC.1